MPLIFLQGMVSLSVEILLLIRALIVVIKMYIHVSLRTSSWAWGLGTSKWGITCTLNGCDKATDFLNLLY